MLRFSSPTVPGNQLLPPPPSPRQQTTASIRQRGDGSSLAHIWQETLLSKGKAGVQSDRTISFSRAGWGDTHRWLRFRSARTHTGTNVFAIENRPLRHFEVSERSLQWTLAKVPDLSTETEKGCTRKHTLKIHHFGHKNSKGQRCQDWVSTCKGYIC